MVVVVVGGGGGGGDVVVFGIRVVAIATGEVADWMKNEQTASHVGLASWPALLH